MAALGALAARADEFLIPPTPKADVTLRISPIVLQLTRNVAITTVGYNGSSPGPILRMREGVPQIVEVINDTDVPEQIHWHGLLLPPEVDGAEEEGTPPVPPHGRRRYRFTPTPAGTRWYHTHTMAMNDLHRGSFTGQFGFLMIESGEPGRYDQEVFLALRDWEPFLADQMIDADTLLQQWPQNEKPDTVDTRPNGLEVTADLYSINDKSLGFGEPIRVREGQRVLFHLLNASAIENRTVSLPGHLFQVFALDGNPVPSPQPVDQILLGPGERVDAYVDMNHPGVWVLGAPENEIRSSGLGIVIEYANQQKQPEWFGPGKAPWDYTVFGDPARARALAARKAGDVETIDMRFEKVPRAYDPFNGFLVNGQPYPHGREFVLHRGRRYRLILRNRTDDAHPLHLHRHPFELVEIYGKPTGGIIKDTVVVPNYSRAVVEFVADQPGPTLFHCHIQQHMDYGFKALFRYA